MSDTLTMPVCGDRISMSEIYLRSRNSQFKKDKEIQGIQETVITYTYIISNVMEIEEFKQFKKIKEI
jgi:hypothetical protein